MPNKDDKILNPATGRWVKRDGKIGKAILAAAAKQPKNKAKEKKDTTDPPQHKLFPNHKLHHEKLKEGFEFLLTQYIRRNGGEKAEIPKTFKIEDVNELPNALEYTLVAQTKRIKYTVTVTLDNHSRTYFGWIGKVIAEVR